jgi:hypothetical protein
MTQLSSPFFVHLVESPSAVDLYVGRGEGELLRRAIELNQIPCTVRLAVNAEAFRHAVHHGVLEAMQNNPESLPILHISAHGFSEGIQLTSGEILTWRELRELLVPVNQALGNCLLVCMSTCEGYAGSRMAMYPESEDHPYFAIIGNGLKPTWPETAVAFATFYHLLAKGQNIPDAVAAMCIASGNTNFFEARAEESRQSYIEYVQNLDTSEARAELEERIEAEDSPENAKWRATE